MAKAEAVTKAVAAVAKRPGLEIKDMVLKSAKQIAKSLPPELAPERIMQIALNVLTRNPKLQLCTPQSFIGSLLACAEMGLVPIAGQAWLIPYANGKTGTSECQLQIGYKGIVKILSNSGVVMTAHEVKANDDFLVDYGSSEPIRHRPPTQGDRGAVIGYYALAHYKGVKSACYMTMDEVTKHAKQHSKSWDGSAFRGPWATDFDSMARKTVMIQGSKFLPLSFEVMRKIEADETTRNYREGIASALDLPSETEWDVGKEVKQPEATEALDLEREREEGFQQHIADTRHPDDK